MSKEDVSEGKSVDWDEVQNYITVMNKAVKLLQTLFFSSRLIKQTHKMLLNSVRKKKLLGEYRLSQNLIGGATIDDAVFVAPSHSSINDLM